MPTQLKRIATVIALVVCLLVTLASGSFLTSLTSVKSLHSASIARGVTPFGVSCGGSASTPC